ncbi:uncharacterized protein LOC111055133 isoform X2 [Nilaparvata lugens]|uniref:uncharacterized protein LOC111055133 isoform X2 n=1 Tax=Nilaparvata lugens TaxID=108931 RepID=UPI00193CA5AF|nr:uncharacterized protein LOC111055133 isoform X2 [Nilaparvata lugens]
MINFRILYYKYCNICGNPHTTEDCSLLQNVEIIPDTVTLSRARLTLPGGLEIIDLADGSTSVIAKNQFKRGAQFGPMIARLTTEFDITASFPLKMFSEDMEGNNDCQFLDTSDENLCNWMSLVPAATCLEEQNLICFQMKNEVYFLLVKDVEPGEQLRVWYAPHYGTQMSAKQLGSSLSNQQVFPMDIEDPIVISTDPCPIPEEIKKRKKKRSVANPLSINSSPELRELLASKLPSTILGAKDPKSEWECLKCGFKSESLPEYAKHLLSHREVLEPYKCCACQNVLSSRLALKRHALRCKSKSNGGTENAETGSAGITSSVVDELDKTVVESNADHIDGYDKAQLNHSDMSNVLDSLTDSTSMKKLLLADSSRLIPCSDKELPFNKEYDTLLDSLTDFRPNSSNMMSDPNYSCEIPLKNKPNTEESAGICNERLSVTAQHSKEMVADNPPILGLGDEIVFQDIKSYTDIEVDKNTGFNNKMIFDSHHTDQQLLQDNGITLKTCDKPDKTDESVDPNDLDLDLLCGGTLDVTEADKERLVDNLIKDSEERLNTSENICISTGNNENAAVTSSINSGENPSQFQIKLENNPFEEIDLTLEFDGPDEQIIADKKLEKQINKSYSCEICNKKFSEASYLYRHFKSHTGEFTCVVCLRVFSRKETLENHMCTSVRVFQCKLCTIVFKTKRDLAKHKKQHHNEQASNNEESWSKLNFRKNLENPAQLPPSGAETNNLETLTRREYVCEQCGSTYKSLRGLTYHRLSRHSERNFTCYICDKKFHRKSILDAHVDTHLKLKKSCPICKTVLSGKKALSNHIRRQTCGTRYKCLDCGKAFPQKSFLLIHKRTEHPDNEKPDDRQQSVQKSTGTQSNADEQPTLKSSDNQQLQTKNKSGNRRKKSRNRNEEYICRYCDTILNNRNSLERHLRVKHQDSREEWSTTEVLDSMRVVIEEVATTHPVAPFPVTTTHQANQEPIPSVNTENNVVTIDLDAAAIQPSTSDTAENLPNATANQLCTLDYEFTLKTDNTNEEPEAIGYQQLTQPLNAAELFQLEDNTPTLILEDGTVVQSQIPLDKELFYLVLAPEHETIFSIE